MAVRRTKRHMKAANKAIKKANKRNKRLKKPQKLPDIREKIKRADADLRALKNRRKELQNEIRKNESLRNKLNNRNWFFKKLTFSGRRSRRANGRIADYREKIQKIDETINKVTQTIESLGQEAGATAEEAGRINQ